MNRETHPPALPGSLLELLRAPAIAKGAGAAEASAILGLRLRCERTTAKPLTVGPIARLFGRKPAPPVLPLLASKYGGLPYLEHDSQWPARGGDRAGFVGQLVFDELETEGTLLPRRGVLAVFLSLHEMPLFDLVWSPEPSSARGRAVEGPSAVDHEARITAEIAPSIHFDPIEALAGNAAEAELEALHAWLLDHGAQVGGYFPGVLDGAGPRDLQPEDARLNEDWLHLWEPTHDGGELTLGSMSYSILIRREDLVATRFDRAATLCWQ